MATPPVETEHLGLFDILVFGFLGWNETESTRYVGHYLGYCISSERWMMMSVEQSVEWLAGETKYTKKPCPSATLPFRDLLTSHVLHKADIPMSRFKLIS
jgi:hypothetical protein